MTTDISKNINTINKSSDRQLPYFDDRIIFEKSRIGTRAWRVPKNDVTSNKAADYLKGVTLRKRPAALPELGELDVIRHYTNLSRLNYAITTTFYPLGSCTMKYNPVMNEVAVMIDRKSVV